MPISPLVPVLGLFVIAANILVSALRPSLSPTLMGVQLFIGGMTTLIIAVVDYLAPVDITEFERVLLFVSGCVNCAIGYYMTLLEMRKRGA